jgi:hypothetical protein
MPKAIATDMDGFSKTCLVLIVIALRPVLVLQSVEADHVGLDGTGGPPAAMLAVGAFTKIQRIQGAAGL